MRQEHGGSDGGDGQGGPNRAFSLRAFLLPGLGKLQSEARVARLPQPSCQSSKCTERMGFHLSLPSESAVRD